MIMQNKTDFSAVTIFKCHHERLCEPDGFFFYIDDANGSRVVKATAKKSKQPDIFRRRCLFSDARINRNKESGELWERDMLHKNHWEVYRNPKDWEKGIRDRAVWDDGRLKQKF